MYLVCKEGKKRDENVHKESDERGRNMIQINLHLYIVASLYFIPYMQKLQLIKF